MFKTITKFLQISLLLIFTATAFSQDDSRWGVYLGATNYVTDTNLLFSKSQPGLEVGFVMTNMFSDRFELMYGVSYARHVVKFVGRETPESTPEDLKFTLEKINIPVTLNYNFWNVNDDLQFGINTGASLSLFHDYKLVDDSKSNYYLDPFYADPDDLAFDEKNSSPSFNVFYILGLTAEYKRFMCAAKYHIGLTDPYRRAPLYSPVAEIKGKDSYYTFTLTYFFDSRM